MDYKLKGQKDKALADAIQKMDCGRGLGYANLFEEFLDVALCMMCNNPNPHQIELATRLNEDKNYNQAFINALEAYGTAAEGYHDPLGDVYMDKISHGHLDQFFTPEGMAILLARICGNDYNNCNDPTCGSGRMLLAGLKLARENGVEPWIYGEDMSYTCIRMATLNMLIQQARGVLRCGDTLKYEQDKMIYFQIERVFNQAGQVVSTYWQYVPSEIDELREKVTAWRYALTQVGCTPEIPKWPFYLKTKKEDPQEVGQLTLF